ncbi:flippase [Pedobacter fastidiosus]|uniref:Flippase n=1 Tax=Pedobacter fastidiosus TaxID=2765361 RepID=A0ABR7KUY2_9SPHI|nr:flippase [Pedobacter fastidiosus]MBC6111850.1 flippase [Pedobacter fastidiosus]
MIPNKSKKQLTKNLLSLTIVQVATYVLPLVSVPVVSRIIGPARYGEINFAAAYIAYFTLLISYSFDFSATRKISKDPNNIDNRNRVFSEVFYTQCLLFLFSTLAFIALLYSVPELKSNKTIMIFSYSLCISTLFTQNWLFQAMQDLSKVALFNLISKVLFTITILMIVRKNGDYIWQPFLIGVIQSIIAIWSFLWAFKNYKIKFVKIPFRACLKVLWEERIIFFSLVFVNFYSTTNTVILGLYQNVEQVGYYTAAQRLIIIAQSVLAMPLAQAFYPYIGKAFGASKDEGMRVAQKLIPLIIIFIGVASVIMLILGPFVIRIFYGSKFEQAIPIFQILTIVPLIFSLNNVLGIQIMLNLKMDKAFFKVTAAAGILSILLNLLMIKQWGYIGTTFNWLITEVFIFISMYIILKRAGLNAINLEYFKFSSLNEYLIPIREKFFQGNKNKNA